MAITIVTPMIWLKTLRCCETPGTAAMAPSIVYESVAPPVASSMVPVRSAAAVVGCPDDEGLHGPLPRPGARAVGGQHLPPRVEGAPQAALAGVLAVVDEADHPHLAAGRAEAQDRALVHALAAQRLVGDTSPAAGGSSGRPFGASS